jgi:hypothetical protein
MSGIAGVDDFLAVIRVAIANCPHRGGAIRVHIIAGDGVALAGAHRVGDDQPGIENPREFNDSENHEQKHREDKREFHQALASGAALSGLPGSDGICLFSKEQFRNHSFLFYTVKFKRPLLRQAGKDARIDCLENFVQVGSVLGEEVVAAAITNRRAGAGVGCRIAVVTDGGEEAQ